MLKSFVLIKAQFDRKVRQIQVDNWGEFDSMHSFFLEQGMIHQHSYCKHLNKMGLLNDDMCLTLLKPFDFNLIFHLPSGECVLNATYLINLLPTPLISKKAPFEKLYNWTLIFGHLHVLEEIYFKYSWWYGTSCCYSVTFPMEQNLKLTPTQRDVFNNSSQYRRLVGRLIYLTITPPNICYLV